MQASGKKLKKIQDDLNCCKAKLKQKEGDIQTLKLSECSLQSSLNSSREIIAKLKVDVEELKVWLLIAATIMRVS